MSAIYKPNEQSTKENQSDPEYLKMFPEAINSFVMFQQPQSTPTDNEEAQEATPDEDPNVEVEISPADVASVDPASFAKFAPVLSAQDIPKITLPDDFTFSISDYNSSSSKYGRIITSPNGNQTVDLDVEVGAYDGIIEYEVRLIKND